MRKCLISVNVAPSLSLFHFNSLVVCEFSLVLLISFVHVYCWLEEHAKPHKQKPAVVLFWWTWTSCVTFCERHQRAETCKCAARPPDEDQWPLQLLWLAQPGSTQLIWLTVLIMLITIVMMMMMDLEAGVGGGRCLAPDGEHLCAFDR